MSTEIRFYHLHHGTVEQSLPLLLSKIHAGGHKIVVKLSSADRVKIFDGLLWTFDAHSFLPHSAGTDKKEGSVDAQEIWLTSEDENPNAANVLVLVDGVTAENVADYEICCEIFNGQDAEAVQTARAHWKMFQEQGLNTVYFQQTERGGWEKKA